MGGLCHLANALSGIVGRHLDLEVASRGRLKLNEEGLTYSLFRLLESWDGARVGVVPWEESRRRESVSGADLEVWIEDLVVDPTFRWFGWRIQAKRARVVGERLVVPGLEKLGQGKRRQVDLLIEGARSISNLLPVYWIYSPRDVAKSLYGTSDSAIHVVSATGVHARIAVPSGASQRVRNWNLCAEVARFGSTLESLWCDPSIMFPNSDHLLSVATKDLWDRAVNPLELTVGRDLEGFVDANDVDGEEIGAGRSPSDEILPVRTSRQELEVISSGSRFLDPEDVRNLDFEKIPGESPPSYVLRFLEDGSYSHDPMRPEALVVLRRGDT